MRPFCEPSQACCPDADAIRRDSFKVVLSPQNVAEAITVAPYSVAPKCRDHAIADLNLPSGRKSTTSTRTCPHKSRQATSRCARMCLSFGRCEVAFRRCRSKSTSRPLSTRGILAPQLTALHLVRSLKRFDVKQPNERLRKSTSTSAGALPRERFRANVRSCSPRHGVASSHARVFMSFPNPPSIMTERPKRLE
jgi:hypothetical protein